MKVLGVEGYWLEVASTQGISRDIALNRYGIILQCLDGGIS